ncbi:nitroreductase family protein [Pseudoalteromonas pernae]|uniref:nitroreductase family protein n=1 Tax=Pseudoalteromonas pernae TaxID=3118054 RepID=UPI00324292D6
MLRITKYLVKKVIVNIQRVLVPICASTPFTSSLYFAFFNGSYRFEQQAILRGQCRYTQSNGVLEGTSPLLRRNIHRLEKGLVMRPRRSVFALDYIEETVAVYADSMERDDMSTSELSWASSILHLYFEVADSSNPIISKQKSIFLSLSKNCDATLLKTPYPSSQRHKHHIEIDEFLALTKARRSCRWFHQEQVSNEVIEKACEAALQAPSACNRQPFKFLVINDENMKRKLSQLPGGTAGFDGNICNLIAVVGDLSCYPSERDRHVIYIDSSLACMQFMLALETLGVSSCPINWPELHQQNKRVTRLLQLSQYERVVMFIAFGYADKSGLIPYSDKKHFKDVIKYI